MTTTAAPSPLPGQQRLPWPFLASALIAFAALYISGNFFVVMPALAVLMVATRLVPFRLPASTVLGWTVRIVVWLVILSISPRRHTTGMSLSYGGSILYEPDYVYLFGYLAAAELVLRLWIASPKGPSRGDALILTALVFTAASNTTDRMPTQILAPIYAVLVILCLRTFDRQPRVIPSPTAPRRLPLVALRFLAGTLAVALAFTAVFVVTRYESDITSWAMQFTRKMPSRQTQIGLSSSPMLTSSFNPQASGNRVLLVDGPYADRHLRAFAFDTYRGGLWSPTLGDRQFDPIPPADLVARTTPGIHLHFTPLVETFDVLLLPLETTGITLDVPLLRDRFGVLRTQVTPDDPAYDAVLPKSDDYQGPLCVAPDSASRQRLLAIPPEIDARVATVAREVAGTGDPASRIQNIVRHLRSHHHYSLTFDIPEDRDPISDFILNHRDAHCQFFASAVVVMARAAGVPARFVNGYYAHELYGSNETVVRDRDAHAWAECYVDGTGWVTVDATPDAGLPDHLFPPPSRLQRFWERLQDLPRNIRHGLSRITLRSALVITGLPLTILAGYWIVQGLRRRRATQPVRRDYPAASEQLTSAAAVFDKILAARGHPCVPNVTWREHLTTLPPETKLDRNTCLQFVQAYDNARFGGDPDTSLAEVRYLLRQLDASSRDKTTPRPSGNSIERED